MEIKDFQNLIGYVVAWRKDKDDEWHCPWGKVAADKEGAIYKFNQQRYRQDNSVWDHYARANENARVVAVYAEVEGGCEKVRALLSGYLERANRIDSKFGDDELIPDRLLPTVTRAIGAGIAETLFVIIDDITAALDGKGGR